MRPDVDHASRQQHAAGLRHARAVVVDLRRKLKDSGRDYTADEALQKAVEFISDALAEMKRF